MADTSIEWTDKVWNPVTGCTKVSAGCANCYAEKVALRFWGKRKFSTVKIHKDRLLEPMTWWKPKRIFVNSMSDLFHESLDFGDVAEIFDVMARKAPQHTYQVLTKRPKRMLEFFEEYMGLQAGGPAEMVKEYKRIGIGWPAKNIWLGVSVESQKTADERIPLLLQTPAAVRFLSVEPMLERVDLKFPVGYPFHWVICGGESGPGARPFNIEWARGLRNQCKQAGVAFFMKQLGAKPYLEKGMDLLTIRGFKRLYSMKSRKGGNVAEWPEDLRIREFPSVK